MDKGLTDSLAENAKIASKNFSTICLPMPKNLGFLKKSSLWVSAVRVLMDLNYM